MPIQSFLRAALPVLACLGTLAVSPAVSVAQGPPGGSLPPAAMEKIKAWQKYRETHKNVSNLSTLLFQIREMDSDPSTRLNKEQAGKLLGVMKAWRNRPTMSEDQAKQAQKQIGGMLTPKQVQKIATIRPRFGGGRMGAGGGAPGGGGTGGGPGGGGMRMDPSKIPSPPATGFNPFNPDTNPMAKTRPEFKKAGEAFVADLEKRAK